MDETARITGNFLLYVLLPLWLIPGLADYLCHRRSEIERHEGLPEAVVHLMAVVVMGVPIMIGLLFEVNGLTLLLMGLAVIVHEVTSYWDVHYATAHREVTPLEQHIHSYLEVLPIMAVSFVVCLHWPVVLALLGWEGTTEFRFVRREASIATTQLYSILLGAGGLLTFVYAEEIWRCWRAPDSTDD